MDGASLKKKYLEFFKSKEHAIIPSASIIPEHDPTVLFTTAGMHPLIQFLQGLPHPLGKRVTNVQKCLRTQDIDEVGDATHTTCFEMLGNWSFGDYFKEDAIKWSWEFLTSKDWLGLDSERLAVTCFAGDKDAPKDEEAAAVWRAIGVPDERIAFLGKKDNWWGPAGQTGPCGPDTEMFYWKLNDAPAPKEFDPNDENWVEIWNDVFMQYDKSADGTFKTLAQQSVDTGMGVERVAMILQGKESIFETELFLPVFDAITELSQKKPEDHVENFRVITDHIRAATFILGDERAVTPSNVDQGYILRRFIRRAIRHLKLLDVDLDTKKPLGRIAREVIATYQEGYPLLKEKEAFIVDELEREQKKFLKTLEKGLNEIKKHMMGHMLRDIDIPNEKKTVQTLNMNLSYWMTDSKFKNNSISLDAKWLFRLFQSHGMPPEMVFEEIEDTYNKVIKNKEQVLRQFNAEFEHHQELSRAGAEQKFKGGLADSSEMTTRLHTATHLLNEALRKVISPDIRQRGSNITPERLRFDFNFDRKLEKEELQKIEDEINSVIDAGLEVTKTEMTPEEAMEGGAQSEFGTRYPEKVSVYRVGDYSMEICMGPHVKNTKELGHFRIKKEQSSAAGIRRIKAVLE